MQKSLRQQIQEAERQLSELIKNSQTAQLRLNKIQRYYSQLDELSSMRDYFQRLVNIETKNVLEYEALISKQNKRLNFLKSQL